MIYKIVESGKWYNVVVASTDMIEDGFDNREDAERYMANLEASDSIGILEQERK